ncbi:TetR/AcrR family transcriptional regulator [Gordonia malaquae]|uniref:TetR/AcrR family transcriptional regulator n=1 Tax=Gordonia malaquae TaxID=410332 RepID=UPI0030FF1660
MEPEKLNRSQLTTQRILDAALELMTEYGAHRTPIETIAHAAGVSHMSVYRRWARKEDLITAILEREAVRMHTELDHRLAEIDDPFDRLVAEFTNSFWHYYTHPFLVGANAADQETTLKALTSASGPMFANLTDYLAGRLVDELGINESHDSVLAFSELLVRISHSLLLTSLDTRTFASREEVEVWGRTRFAALLQFARGW